MGVTGFLLGGCNNVNYHNKETMSFTIDPHYCSFKTNFFNKNPQVRIWGTLGDIDPLSKVPFKRATSGVQRGVMQDFYHHQ